MLQIIETPEGLQIGSWSFSFYSRSRREGNPIRTMMLALYDRMEQSVILVLDTETESSRLSCTPIYAITNRKDEISFRLEKEVDPHSDFLEKSPVCLVWYRSTNHKTVDQGKASLRNKKTLR